MASPTRCLGPGLPGFVLTCPCRWPACRTEEKRARHCLAQPAGSQLCRTSAPAPKVAVCPSIRQSACPEGRPAGPPSCAWPGTQIRDTGKRVVAASGVRNWSPGPHLPGGPAAVPPDQLQAVAATWDCDRGRDKCARRRRPRHPNRGGQSAPSQPCRGGRHLAVGRDCHCTDTPSPSLLTHPLTGEGGAAG